MHFEEAIRRAQGALYEQDPTGNTDVVEFFDGLRNAFGHVEDAKLYIDKIAAVVTPDAP